MLDYVPLAPEQRRQFDEQGYLIVRGVLTADECARLIAAGDPLIAGELQTNRSTTGVSDSLRNCIALDDAFLPLITHPLILPLVIQLLGANLHLITSHLIYKGCDPPGTPATHRLPGWHRDYYAYMNDLGHGAVTRVELKCAYYLTDLREPNSGVTMVVPGSNLLRTALAVPDGSDPVGAVEPSLAPGDCLIFENRTWHAGAANLSGRTRKALMIGYGYRWLMPMDYRNQADELLAKVSPLARYLLGQRWGDDPRFHVGGGENPLLAWCREHQVDAVRHPL